MVQVCVAFGANLGEAQATVLQAIQDVGALATSQLVKASSLYASAPHEAAGPEFVNAVAIYDTELPPLALLDALQNLEKTAGRERPYLNAPRTLDLDIIFYGDIALDSPRLTLPHPRWQKRAFVLVPLAEISPDKVSPALLSSVANQSVRRIG
ncbi:MAG: 2-amino-4-hydroxy-6-hydroxymethyldihydropteridine diphosphokinase [Limnohabitans sp.]